MTRMILNDKITSVSEAGEVVFVQILAKGYLIGRQENGRPKSEPGKFSSGVQDRYHLEELTACDRNSMLYR